ncbi:Uncharacterised protein [Legionella israelensis]|nr:hypothetical protein SAMN02746069_01395 [Legionella israelensis DSM 19235]STX59377.1 Uncharacterised protein [Legionella israelensis]
MRILIRKKWINFLEGARIDKNTSGGQKTRKYAEKRVHIISAKEIGC